MCVCGCCRQVEDCLPPEGLSLPAACGNHGALPGYKPLVCTDKKTWRAKINYLQADPCTPRLAWHFSCIKCHYLWSHPFYCLFYLSTVENLLHRPAHFVIWNSHVEGNVSFLTRLFYIRITSYGCAFFRHLCTKAHFENQLLNRPQCSLMVPALSQLFSVCL